MQVRYCTVCVARWCAVSMCGWLFSYRQCGRCCRGNPQSVCMAHGMGALVAAEMVERAITFQLLELDLRFLLSLL